MQVAENKQVEYATLNRRVIAITIDLLLLIILLFFPSLLIEYIIYGGEYIMQPTVREDGPFDLLLAFNQLSQNGFFIKWFIVQLFTYFFAGILYMLCWWKIGTTPGKWITECKILDERTLTEPTRVQYLKRYLAFVPSNLPLTLGFLMLGLDAKKRAWHDRMAGTVVVRKPHEWNKITGFLNKMVNRVNVKGKKYF